MAALFVISDLNLIDESVYKLVSFLLPKILTPQ